MHSPHVLPDNETVLYSEDLDRARAFYEEGVGLAFMSLDSHRGIGFRVDSRSVLLIFNPGETVKAHERVPSHGATAFASCQRRT